MSCLNNIRKFDIKLNKSILLNCIAYNCYSKNSSDSFYKIVKSKVRLEDESSFNNIEGGPNWELFAPRGNRFYLPGLAGPAWQGSSTTLSVIEDLETLINFDDKTKEPSKHKLQIEAKKCPVLLRNNLHELFPAPEVFNKGHITLITLSHNVKSEEEKGAKNFVLAAREMCTRLRLNGYWADFMNPFSGKPFYSYASGKKLYKIDDRFRGLGIKFEDQNDCLIISADNEETFSGSIFTNAPSDLTQLQLLIND